MRDDMVYINLNTLVALGDKNVVNFKLFHHARLQEQQYPHLPPLNLWEVTRNFKLS